MSFHFMLFHFMSFLGLTFLMLIFYIILCSVFSLFFAAICVFTTQHAKSDNMCSAQQTDHFNVDNKTSRHMQDWIGLDWIGLG